MFLYLNWGQRCEGLNIITSESNDWTIQNQFVHSAVYLYIPVTLMSPSAITAFSLRLSRASPRSSTSLSRLSVFRPCTLMFHSERST